MDVIEASLRTAIHQQGFRSPEPPPSYHKQDIRGPEYGHIAAVVIADKIRVYHSQDKYTMYFHCAQDFQRWARAQT